MIGLYVEIKLMGGGLSGGIVSVSGGVGKRVQSASHFSLYVDFSERVVGSNRGVMALV